jgi:hypothetical protein
MWLNKKEIKMTSILKFYSNSCMPCKVLTERIKSLDSKVNIWEIDITDNSNCSIIERYSIMSIPTLLKIDKNGNELQREVGLISIDKLANFLGV